MSPAFAPWGMQDVGLVLVVVVVWVVVVGGGVLWVVVVGGGAECVVVGAEVAVLTVWVTGLGAAAWCFAAW